MIRVAELTKRFGERLAIDGVSFEVGDGEILGFLGPNGAGKTTTMRILTGYMPPSAGTAEIEGFDVLLAPQEVKKRVGYLPESPPLYQELLVGEYLRYVAALKGIRRAERQSAVDRVAGRCGLGDVQGRLIGNLSKGYRQRVGLAQALIHDPKVVILDEPTSGLDPNQIQEVRALIREIARERTVILSTHIMQEVEALCDKVAIINDGRIVAVDHPEKLSESIGSAGQLRLRLARPPSEAGVLERELSALEGVLTAAPAAPADGHHFEVKVGADPAAREQVARWIVEKGYGLLEMRDEGSRLEGVFQKLTKESRPAVTRGDSEEGGAA